MPGRGALPPGMAARPGSEPLRLQQRIQLDPRLSLRGSPELQPASLKELRRPRSGRQLPEILSQREMLRLLDSLRNRNAPGHPFPGVCRGTARGGGRASQGEFRHRQRSHVDPGAPTGKGRKDRCTLLPRSILEDLRSSLEGVPAVDVAVSGSPGKTASHGTVRRCPVPVETAGLRKRVRCIGLRHEVCDAPLEGGTPGMAPRTQELENDGDLHPCEAEGSGAYREPPLDTLLAPAGTDR